MALDTANKRASSVQLLTWPVLAPPLPDGTLSGVDFAHQMHLYAGIAFDAAAAPISFPVAYAGDRHTYGGTLADRATYGHTARDRATYGAALADRVGG